jgi:dTDP-4-amino-4,6-dideoxygalactose transaminase
MKIPFLSFEPIHAPIKKEMLEAFEKVYDSYWYILGKSVSAFEDEYARFSNTKYCVGVSNGLDALFLSLKALGIGEGDEVIVPSNSYIATLLAVTYTGAKPVLVEPDIRTYNIDPKKIPLSISERTKAIIPIHLYGQACEMDSIIAVAKEYGLYVIEDNAQSHGATFKNQITGSWGHINGTSFYPGKNFGALGDAGAITTNDEILAKKVVALRNYGSSKKYFNEVIGNNMRLDELQAALLSVKLKYLQSWTNQRKQLGKWYTELLADIPGLILPYTSEGATHVFHLYVIRTEKRDALQQYLAECNIGTMIHYPVPPHLQEAYKDLGFKVGDFPIAEELAKTSLSIPLWPGMTKDIIGAVADSIKKFFSK